MGYGLLSLDDNLPQFRILSAVTYVSGFQQPQFPMEYRNKRTIENHLCKLLRVLEVALTGPRVKPRRVSPRNIIVNGDEHKAGKFLLLDDAPRWGRKEKGYQLWFTHEIDGKAAYLSRQRLRDQASL